MTDDTAHPRATETEGAGAVPLVAVLLDGLAGSNAQTRGVARALGCPVIERTLSYEPERPWERLAGLVRPTADTRAALLAPPRPALVLSAGRRAGATARWMRDALVRRDGHGPRLVHIQDPRFHHAAFDRVIVPRHDRRVAALSRRANVRVVTGAPHPLTEAQLHAAATRWRDSVADRPRPWIALLVGGDSGRRRLDADVSRRLVGQAEALARRAGGTLLVTTSRRTRPDALTVLETMLAPPAVLMPWTEDRTRNPYLGFLGLADAIIVTGDSISMLTEATTPAVPLYIFAPPGWARRPHARYHAELVALGAARPLDDDTPWQPWHGVPVNPAAAIAEEARALLRTDGWGLETGRQRE